MPPKWPPDPLTVLRGHSGEINALSFGAIGSETQCLVSGDTLGQIRLWDIATRRTVKQIDHAHAAALIELKFLTDGRVRACAVELTNAYSC